MKDHSPGFLRLAEDARARAQEISAVDASRSAAQGKARLIDVREDHEWQAGHPAGAIHLSRGILERDIEKLVPEPDAPLILMCGGGFRSALAADALQKMGYTNVQSLAGGWSAWEEAGLPTERPA